MKHLILLAVCGAAIVGAYFAARKWPLEKLTKVLFSIGVVSPPQAGLPWLNEEKGWQVYILRYAALVVFCVTACYCRPIYRAVKARLSKRCALSSLDLPRSFQQKNIDKRKKEAYNMPRKSQTQRAARTAAGE